MKVLPKYFLHIFSIVFLFFSLTMINYWSDSMMHEKELSTSWWDRTSLLLVGFGFFMWFANGHRRYRGIHLICLLWVIFMPVILWLNHGGFYQYVKTLIWPVLFELSYMLVYQKENRGNQIRALFIPIFLYGLFFFIQSRADIVRQTNTIYFSFLTLPWLLYNRNKKTQLIILIIFTLMCFLSLKRSVILAIAFIWAFQAMQLVKGRRNVIYTLIVIFVAFFSLNYFYDRVNEQTGGLLEERLNREETETGRNRLAIWEVTREMIASSSLIDLIIGHGHYAVYRDSPLQISAHNDLLEVIYDYGLIIFVLYLGLWWYVIKRCIHLYRIRSDVFLPYATSMSIFISMSMVGHLILYTSYFNFLVVFWGCMEGHEKPEFKK